MSDDIVERLRVMDGLETEIAADEIERLRGEVERLTLERDYWARARNEWEKSARLLEEENKRLTRERDEAREAASVLRVVSDGTVARLEEVDEERDAALARAEAAERERDEAREVRDAARDGARVNTAAMRKAVELAQEYKARANAAEAKVAKLREALKPFAMLAHCLDYKNSQWLDHETHWMRVVNFNPEPTVGDLRRARTALQETER